MDQAITGDRPATSDPTGLETLRVMRADMETAPEAFRPTNFWSGGVARLAADLEAGGMQAFRTLPSALDYFVPAYADKFFLRHERRIEGLLSRLKPRRRASFRKAISGLGRAMTDYRLYRATTTGSALGLEHADESPVGGGERFGIEGRSFSRSMLNYLRALTLLERSVDCEGLTGWLEIGGGYGTLGEIVLKGRQDAFYINVDIPPVAAVSTWYLKQVFGDDAVLGYDDSREMDRLDIDALRARYRAVVLCPWQLPDLTGQIDVFANFISFQEMEPPVVANYARLVQPLTARHVLMRNSAHGKTVARSAGEHGVLEPVTTEFTIAAFDAFAPAARDSLVHGDTSPDGSFRSEVNLLTRKGPLA